MKVVIPLVVFGSLIAAPAAFAKDVKEVLRDNLAFCAQFVIQDPDPGSVFNRMHDCCAFSQNIRDCPLSDWGTFAR
jgi:hypothetical protein